MNENQSIGRKRGRPATEIQWPTNSFTVEDIKNQIGGTLTKVAIQLRIKKAVRQNTLAVEGKQQIVGRPRITYKRVLASA